MSDFAAFLIAAAIFGAVYVYVEHLQYVAGHNTVFFAHKTEEEKRLREAQIKYQEAHANSIDIQNTIQKQRHDREF